MAQCHLFSWRFDWRRALSRSLIHWQDSLPLAWTTKFLRSVGCSLLVASSTSLTWLLISFKLARTRVFWVSQLSRQCFRKFNIIMRVIATISVKFCLSVACHRYCPTSRRRCNALGKHEDEAILESVAHTLFWFKGRTP